MDKSTIWKELERVGTLIQNTHVVYTSGKHGNAYVNKDAVYPHTALTSSICREMGKAFVDESPQCVLGPALGGIILAQWTSHHLMQLLGNEVLSVYAEKKAEAAEEGFVLKRGYDNLVRGKRTLIVEDILTTGISVRKVVEAAKDAGALVVGIAALCNRGGLQAKDLGVEKLFAMTNVTLETWDETDCPLCRSGVSIRTDIGKGTQFLAKRKT